MPHTPTADLTREPRPSEGSSGDARPPQLWRGRRQQDNREQVVLDGSRVGRHLLYEHFPEVAESLSGEFLCDYRDRLRAHLDVRVCFSTNVLQPCGRAGSTAVRSSHVVRVVESDVAKGDEARLAGTGMVNLTNRAGDDNSPAWSPDGTKIAFASDRSGTLSIWTMNGNGTGLRNITQSLPGHTCANPAWSAAPLSPIRQP
jgi:hypothetical protein